MEEIQDIQLAPGYFFAPGFYMNYWHSTILTNFDPQVVAFHGRLKQHREVWVGAHLAALKTYLSGEKHFVALPERDPPDVLVGSFTNVTVSSGRVGRNLSWFPIEITRCDMASSETLLQQIENKNTPAYTNTVLVVYLQGTDTVPSLQELYENIQAFEEVYLHEIIVLVELQADANNVPSGTFGFVQVYPNHETVVVDRNDHGAYFTEPNIFRVTGRGVQDEMENLGLIRLLPPVINN